MTPAESKRQYVNPVEWTPFNGETPLEALRGELTSARQFYVRNHFDAPQLDASTWRLRIDGLVRQPMSLSLVELQQRPLRIVRTTLECAGNGRTVLTPRPPGTPWGFGAVSTAEFGGTALRPILDEAGVERGAVEALFVGADRGAIDEQRQAAFERSLPLGAIDDDVMLAWTMNGEPLAVDHGFPVRLIVPNWYAVASVKWLTRISLIAEPFRGFYQHERYTYEDERGTPQREPVSKMRVRSLIAWPTGRETLRPGEHVIEGAAWSGEAEIARVEVSVDSGQSWARARLIDDSRAGRAARWQFDWPVERPGTYTLMSRATDAAGKTQPRENVVNRLGYGNNVAQRVAVTVESARA